MSESETKGQSQEQKTSKLAIWSMVFGIVGFLSILGLFETVARLQSMLLGGHLLLAAESWHKPKFNAWIR